ncbi:MAG: hypothetical protein WCS43_06175 [Verrucomicrobiota bacterium]
MHIRMLGLATALIGAFGLSLPASGEDFWMREDNGTITHHFKEGQTPIVLCMQGRKVVMEVHLDPAKGLLPKTRFFNVPKDRVDKGQAVFDEKRDLMPVIFINGKPMTGLLPTKASFDGRLMLTYSAVGGVVATRTIYPSMTKALVIDEWRLRNTGDKPLKVEVKADRIEKREGEKVVMVWQSQVVDATALPGGELAFHASIHARLTDEPDMTFDVAAERAGRQAVADAAWKGPSRLETPDRDLDIAYALQKFHVLETPIETHKGVITHNGSLTYSPGIWANDPVEYSSPLFPFFGDPELNKAGMNMYRIWLDYCRENGIDPFPGSFEHADLKLCQRWRGDDAMVLYGLSKFLLFQGDRAAAEEMWPLIEFSAQSVLKNTRHDGIVASKTDEMEGRYPTGDANLSTSSLAYGGYRHAAILARSLNKPVAAEFDQRADVLRKAIDSFFGAEVEGFNTYRYFKGNDVLRGWILLPLAMGITERQSGTLDAMVSDKLWPTRMQGGDILAASDHPETEWGRETYYALRVMFKSGRTEQALDLTQRVVKAQIFGQRGPYPDEDAIDMLCPGSLYPRVFTEGMFGIVPAGLDSFECTPWLPKDWPRMALHDVRAFGKAWDIVVEREGDMQKTTVLCGGRKILSETGRPGKIYRVNLSDVPPAAPEKK